MAIKCNSKPTSELQLNPYSSHGDRRKITKIIFLIVDPTDYQKDQSIKYMNAYLI